MAETLAALIAAHVLADFLLQPDWMAAGKHRVWPMIAHLAVICGANAVVMGSLAPAIFALGLFHLGQDMVKTGLGRKGPVAFIADQAAHGAALTLVALTEPGLWAAGLWAGQTALPGLLALAAGFILATRAGGYLIALAMARWDAAPRGGLAEGGRVIGQLERALIFVLVIGGDVGAIGFLIAAKSILRFGTIKDDRKISEYVIIGTLASFLWALLVAKLTLAAMTGLPPIGILTKTP